MTLTATAVATVAAEAELHARPADEMEPFVEHIAVKARRTRIVVALVDGELGRDLAQPVGAPLPAADAGRDRRANHDGGGTGQRVRRQPPGTEVPPLGLVRATGRPLVDADPATGVEWHVSGGWDRLLEPHPHVGVGDDAGVDAAQPVVPPAGSLLEEADGRPRHAVLGVRVTPRPDDPLAGRAGGTEPLDELEHRSGVAVRPAAHREHRDLDRREILDHRAVTPELIAVLMIEPCGRCELGVLDAMDPHLAPPFVSDDLRIGGKAFIAKK